MPEASTGAWIERSRRHHLELRRRRARRGCPERRRSAYVGKTIDPAELPEIVRAAAGGAPFTVSRPGAERDDNCELSEREVTVLAALTRGLSNRQIGEELWVSEQTVKFHLRNVYRKIDVKKRAEAVRWAYSHGIGRELSRVAQ